MLRTNAILFRVAAAVAAAALLVGPILPIPAYAQAEAPASQDPPAVVGRVARLSGTVSFHGAGETQWEPATLNFPVSSGTGLWTEPNSGAEVEVAGVRAVLDQGTQFDIDQLGDHALQATISQGSVFLAVRGLPPGVAYQVRTPRGVATIAQDGQYEISAGDTDHPTVVGVVNGQAQVAGDNVSLLVQPGQAAQITGAGPFQGSVGALAPSPFLAGLTAPVRPMPVGQYAPPPVVQQMTGGEVLADSGRWDNTPQYGQVWYPPVDPGWVPYRHGHWAYVAPWGWTWIEDENWGFAPFHYGRWVMVGPSWAWVPVVPGVSVGIGIGYQPVYAPALVAFVGLGALAVGLNFGHSVGWVPLGPFEPYYPPYRVSPAYVRSVNITNVTNVTTINNYGSNTGQFVNRGATTVVPSTAMTGSQPVAARVQPVPASALSQIQPVRGAPVQPTASTRGVTPAVAQQMHLAPATAPTPRAPGPVVHTSAAPVPLHTAGAPISQAVTPRPATTVASPRPAAPGPAITPRPATGQAGVAPLPQLRPTAPTTSGQTARPATPAVPQVAPQVQHAAPVQPAAPQVQHVAPVQPAAPQAQHAAPVQPAMPQVQHSAPAPQPQAEPQPHYVPQAQPQPQPHYAPEPQRPAPQPSHQNCPPGRPTC